jgi:hypothetical protein
VTAYVVAFVNPVMVQVRAVAPVALQVRPPGWAVAV